MAAILYACPDFLDKVNVEVVPQCQWSLQQAMPAPRYDTRSAEVTHWSWNSDWFTARKLWTPPQCAPDMHRVSLQH